MKRIVTATLAAVALAACFDDPTSGLRNGPNLIRLSRNAMFIAPGDSVNITGSVYDEQGNQVPATLTFTSVDAAVATAGDDASLTQPGPLETGGYVKGTGAGQTWVRVTSGSVSDSVRVTVVPVAFTGVVAPTSGPVGTEMTITMPAGVTLNTANAVIMVNGGDPFITAISAGSVSFIPPATGAASVVTISGLVLTAINLDLPALDATTTISVTDATEPGNGAPLGGATIAVPTTVGGTTVVYGTISSADVDDFWTVTPAAGGTLEVTLEWVSDEVDVDMYMLNAAATLNVCGDDFFACGAGTGAYPEVGTATVTGGTTYNLYLNLFDDGGRGAQAYRLTVKRTS